MTTETAQFEAAVEETARDVERWIAAVAADGSLSGVAAAATRKLIRRSLYQAALNAAGTGAEGSETVEGVVRGWTGYPLGETVAIALRCSAGEQATLFQPGTRVLVTKAGGGEVIRNSGSGAVVAPTATTVPPHPDSVRLDWLAEEAMKGKVYPLQWYGRQTSTWDEHPKYDIPAGFYYNDDDGGPFRTLRAAIDAAMGAALPEAGGGEQQ